METAKTRVELKWEKIQESDKAIAAHLVDISEVYSAIFMKNTNGCLLSRFSRNTSIGPEELGTVKIKDISRFIKILIALEKFQEVEGCGIITENEKTKPPRRLSGIGG